MKGYCPKCKKEVDETEFIQNEGQCFACSIQTISESSYKSLSKLKEKLKYNAHNDRIFWELG